jgi:hypothetical protein
MNLYTRYSEYVLYVSYACMRTQLASPAESGMTIILERLCIIQLKPYAREINHICNNLIHPITVHIGTQPEAGVRALTTYW